ncbi:hypothetical protein PSTG_14469 [Puccinia striiformis f. sp. tritici PST-78]|uniref:Uncharacterized protein n=1 Tax=Puccinia striiformis f. sp. tritici PST-78 TaxID=1165861 RepID=A0A0L0UYN8_9BASI|nr:hypothetical protein PSTG_14469 [Puccinia striiformis f. sp. tritici PST-78]
MKVVAKKAEAELQEAKQEAALAVIAAGVNITKANTLATAATATTIQKGPKKFSGSRGAMAEHSWELLPCSAITTEEDSSQGCYKSILNHQDPIDPLHVPSS